MSTAVEDKIRFCEQLLQAAKQSRLRSVQRWEQDYRMLFNRYWREDRRKRSLPSPAVPYIWSIVRDVAAWLTDSPIAPIVTAEIPPDHPEASIVLALSDDMRAVLDSTHIVNGEQAEIDKMLVYGLCYGTGFLKTVWDPSLSDGLGDATIRAVHPQALYPDPHATSELDANFIIEARKLPLATVDRLFPGAADRLRDRPSASEPSPPSRATLETPDEEAGIWIGGIGDSGPAPWVRSRRRFVDTETVVLYELWLREYRHVELDDPDLPQAARTRTHENWRVIVWAADQILLDEKASDIYGHGQHPYSRWVPYETGEFWGWSLVRLLTPSQVALNRLLAAMHNNVELVGSPPIVYPTNAGLDRREIVNVPGQRLEVSPATTMQPYWLQPPSWHPGFMDLVQYHLVQMENVAGLSVAGRQANRESEVAGVSETAFVTIRSMIRSLERTLSRAGTLKASLISENYTEPRMLYLFGPSGDVSYRYLKARHFYVASGGGVVPLRYHVIVRAGSDTHTNRRLRANQAITLGGMGFLDEEEVLRALQWPNAQQVADRVRTMKAMGALKPPGVRQRTRRAGG